MSVEKLTYKILQIMKTIETTTAFILEKRHPLKDETYPIKLRVTHSRVQKYFSLSKIVNLDDFKAVQQHPSLTENQWSKVQGSKPRNTEDLNAKDIALELNTIESSILEKIAGMGEFTFKKFETLILKRSDKRLIREAYKARIRKLSETDRAGTASSYECSMNSIMKFAANEKLNFDNIDQEFCEKYEKWMLTNSKSLTTVGIYLRPLRSLFNEAMQDGFVKLEKYPFGVKRYEIPGTTNKKKALNDKDLKLLFSYNSENRFEQRALDYWKFSYISNGINLKDMAQLRFKDIDFAAEKFSFIREKTKRSNRQHQTKVEVFLHPVALEIINRLGNDQHPDNFVFPIFTNEMTAAQRTMQTKILISNINANLKRIAGKIEITGAISFYYARHSFATKLKRKGISTEFIKESLGHSNIEITQNYLDSFEDKYKKSVSETLTDFE